ncbi:MAG: metal-sensitive transcriptional regulator [Nitrospinota bacterium]
MERKKQAGAAPYLPPELEEDLLRRLARIEGHVRGVSRMLVAHESCDDILIQLSAVKRALAQVTLRLLEGHMDSCVRACVEGGEGPRALRELKNALASALRHG